MQYFFRITIFVLSVLIFGNSYGQEKLTLQNFSAIPSNSKVFHILEKGNNIMISTNKGLYKLNTSTNEVELLLKGKSIRHIAYLSNRRFIAASKYKILDSDGKALHKFDSEVQIYKLVPYKNQIWVATNNGIYVLNKKIYNVKKHYTTKNSKLLDNDIRILHKDNEDKLWIGMDDGLIIVKNRKWKYDFKNQKTKSITENKEGLWVLTDKDLRFTNYNGRGTDLGLDYGLKRGEVTNIAINSEGKLYIASNFLIGLDPYSDESNHLGNEIELLSKQVSTSLFDKNDRLWVGTNKSGLFLLTIEKIDQAVTKANSSEDKTVSDVNFNVFLLVKSDIQCHDSKNGKLEVQASGGIPPYRFRWNTSSQANIIEDLSAGEYKVTVTDTRGNEAYSSISISSPQPIKIDIEKKKPATSSGNDGFMSIEISGGTPGYNIRWDGVDGDTENSRLSIGPHTVTAIDQYGCVNELDFEINAPKILSDLSVEKLKVGQTLPIKQLFFDADSTDVKEDSYAVLSEIFEFMVANDGVSIEIGGHTNNIPTHAYCDKLSTNRAKHVAEYLISKGLPKDRIKYKGYGKRNPIASNKTVGGRKKNQRVELKILSL